MADMDHTLKAIDQLDKIIDEHRQQLLQANGVLTCLYEVLLHAECAEAVSYPQAAYVARALVDKGAEAVDSVRIGPLLDALAPSAEKVDDAPVLYVN